MYTYRKMTKTTGRGAGMMADAAVDIATGDMPEPGGGWENLAKELGTKPVHRLKARKLKKYPEAGLFGAHLADFDPKFMFLQWYSAVLDGVPFQTCHVEVAGNQTRLIMSTLPTPLPGLVRCAHFETHEMKGIPSPWFAEWHDYAMVHGRKYEPPERESKAPKVLQTMGKSLEGKVKRFLEPVKPNADYGPTVFTDAPEFAERLVAADGADRILFERDWFVHRGLFVTDLGRKFTRSPGTTQMAETAAERVREHFDLGRFISGIAG
ncbi:hypothetical protein [Salininema proteolyticum]|uniref:Uncharacterized protein n=1 Tax=Salininema proteolyticum TaxID=1607685 RepID=A0ABV8U3E8_9ACTN